MLRTKPDWLKPVSVGAALRGEELHPNDQVRVILGALEVRRGFRISSVRSFMVGIPFDVR